MIKIVWLDKELSFMLFQTLHIGWLSILSLSNILFTSTYDQTSLNDQGFKPYKLLNSQTLNVILIRNLLVNGT